MTTSLMLPDRPLRVLPATPEGSRGARRLLRPGWPLTAALAGLPLWWVLGISSFIGHIAAVFMVLELVRRRRIRVPRSMGIWLLFLLWAVAGVLVLQVTAPEAIPSTSAGRYFTWAYRFGWYFSATVAMVYVGNMRDVLSLTRIARAGALAFLTIVAGGWLGILMPSLAFPSLLEVVLPSSLTNVPFVEFLIHPEVVQDYAQAATAQARPSAPFSYSNIWGLNFACFLPFFVMAWTGRDAGWRRRLAAPLLLLALVPAIISLNRGMWLAVIAMVVFVAARAASMGRFKALLGIGALTVALAAVLVLSPLGGLIQSRFDNPVSNDGRQNLASLTVTSVLEGSPVIGFGSTRDAQGAFFSIAGASSPSCPLCSPPALGTQGQLWLVLFSHGALGLLFYLGFQLLWLVRGLRLPSAAATTGMAVIVAQIVTLPFYDSIGMSTMALLIGVGFVWVEDDRRRESLGDFDPDDEYTVGGYAAMIRRHALVITVCGVVGAAAGAGLGVWRGPQAVGQVSVLMPEESTLANVGREATLDTLAQLAKDEEVLRAMSVAAGRPVEEDDIYVSADPNSRILTIRYAGVTEQEAKLGATAAGEVIINLRERLLDVERTDAVTKFDAQYAARLKALDTVDEAIRKLGGTPGRPDPSSSIGLLEGQRQVLLLQAGRAAGQGTRASVMALDAGRIVLPATAETKHDRLQVLISSGLFLGVLGGLLLARMRGVAGPRLRAVKDIVGTTGVPVLAHLPAGAVSERGSLQADRELEWAAAVAATRLRCPLTVVSVGGDVQSRLVAGVMDTEILRFGRSPGLGLMQLGPDNRVVLVASSRTRLGTLRRRMAAAVKADLDVVGLILIDRTREGPKSQLSRTAP